MKLFYKYVAIFFNFSPTSSHLHSLQVENCDSNSRLVVNEDDNDKLRLERVKLALSASFEYIYGMGPQPLEVFLLLQRGD